MAGSTGQGRPARKAAAAPRRKAAPRAGTRKANPARGEHSIELAGKTYLLRPTFAASQAIEEELGQSLIELLRRANGCTLSYAEMGTICAEYIRAGAESGDRMTRAVSAERIAELIYEEGSAQVFVALTLLLADAVSGGRTAEGEAKAPEAT